MTDENYTDTVASLESRLRALTQRKQVLELELHAVRTEERRVFSAHTAMKALVSPPGATSAVTPATTGASGVVTGTIEFGGSGTATVSEGRSIAAVERPSVKDAVFALIRSKPGVTRKEVIAALEHATATKSGDVRKLLGTRIGQMVTRKQIIEHEGGLYLHGQELPMVDDGTLSLP